MLLKPPTSKTQTLRPDSNPPLVKIKVISITLSKQPPPPNPPSRFHSTPGDSVEH